MSGDTDIAIIEKLRKKYQPECYKDVSVFLLDWEGLTAQDGPTFCHFLLKLN